MSNKKEQKRENYKKKLEEVLAIQEQDKLMYEKQKKQGLCHLFSQILYENNRGINLSAMCCIIYDYVPLSFVPVNIRPPTEEDFEWYADFQKNFSANWPEEEEFNPYRFYDFELLHQQKYQIIEKRICSVNQDPALVIESKGKVIRRIENLVVAQCAFSSDGKYLLLIPDEINAMENLQNPYLLEFNKNSVTVSRIHVPILHHLSTKINPYYDDIAKCFVIFETDCPCCLDKMENPYAFFIDPEEKQIKKAFAYDREKSNEFLTFRDYNNKISVVEISGNNESGFYFSDPTKNQKDVHSKDVPLLFTVTKIKQAVRVRRETKPPKLKIMTKWFEKRHKILGKCNPSSIFLGSYDVDDDGKKMFVTVLEFGLLFGSALESIRNNPLIIPSDFWKALPD